MKDKSVNLLKNVRYLYKYYIPTIIRSNNGIKYNLSEENIFGNLNYSINKNLLSKNKMENVLSSINVNKQKKVDVRFRSSNLVPIIKFKPCKYLVK